MPALQDMSINSVIGVRQSGEAVKADTDGMIAVKGCALPQGSDGPVVKVEVSVDEGKAWTEAKLIGERGKWSWTLWEARLHAVREKICEF